MRVLLAFFLVTFSLYANNNFMTEKENTVKRLKANNADIAVRNCVQNASTQEEMDDCGKIPDTTPVNTQEKIKIKTPPPKPSSY